MIKITYHRNLNRVCIDGHARSGEIGHDIVCAAVSCLVCTLAENVRRFQSEQKVRRAIVDLEAGKSEVSCKPMQRYRFTIGLIFDSICVGFECLSEIYPENVTYEVKE